MVSKSRLRKPIHHVWRGKCGGVVCVLVGMCRHVCVYVRVCVCLCISVYLVRVSVRLHARVGVYVRMFVRDCVCACLHIGGGGKRECVQFRFD